MKSIATFGLSMALALLTVGSNCLAQDTIPIKTLPGITVTAKTKRIPEKVWHSFMKYFGEGEDPRWYQLNKDYLVKFMLDEEQNNALFTKRGHLIYNIAYGYENSLPSELRKQVKSSYFDYNITRAVKVSEADRLIWVINLEDAKELILVRLENGEMEEVKRLKKTD